MNLLKNLQNKNNLYSKLPTIRLDSRSGHQYTFEIYPIGALFNNIAGVYIFIFRGHNGLWNIVYIGETSSFERRLEKELEQHHQWKCIIKNGASHIGILKVFGGKIERLKIEQDLRNCYITAPCNKQ